MGDVVPFPLGKTRPAERYLPGLYRMAVPLGPGFVERTALIEFVRGAPLVRSHRHDGSQELMALGYALHSLGARFLPFRQLPYQQEITPHD